MFGTQELAWSAGREYNNAPRDAGMNGDGIDAASLAPGQRRRDTQCSLCDNDERRCSKSTRRRKKFSRTTMPT
jgi:hypothetical protein